MCEDPFARNLLYRDWYGRTRLLIESQRESMRIPQLDTDRILRRLRDQLPADAELDTEEQAVAREAVADAIAGRRPRS